MICKLKKGLVWMIFVHFIFLTGCSLDVPSIPGNPDPDPISEGMIHEFLDIELESSYDNVVARTEKDIYPTDADEIICTVQNNNVGKGFYIYEIPFVERSIDEKWVRLYYEPSDLSSAQWVFCGVEGNTTEPNASNLIVFLKDIKAELIPGEYRLVVFTAERKVYATFTLTDGGT